MQPFKAHSPRPIAGPAEWLNKLKTGNLSYRDLFGSRETATTTYSHIGSTLRSESAFHRPKVGFVVLTPDRQLSPAELFHQAECDLHVERVDLEKMGTTEICERVGYVTAVNRLQLLVILAVVEPRARGPFDWLRPWRTREVDLVAFQKAHLPAQRLRQALLSAAPHVASAVQAGELGIIEALYDLETREATLDLDRDFREGNPRHV